MTEPETHWFSSLPRGAVMGGGLEIPAIRRGYPQYACHE